MKFAVLALVAALQSSQGFAEPLRLAQAFAPGGLPPGEVLAIVRSAGLMPVAPPQRAGPTYVVEAVDPRGMALRVIIDARLGEIVAVRRSDAADVVRPPREVPPGSRSLGPPPTAEDPDEDVAALPPARLPPRVKRQNEGSARALPGPAARPKPAEPKIPDKIPDKTPELATPRTPERATPPRAARTTKPTAKADGKAVELPPVTPLQ